MLKIQKSACNRFEIQHAGVTADVKFVFFVIIISINTTSSELLFFLKRYGFNNKGTSAVC